MAKWFLLTALLASAASATAGQGPDVYLRAVQAFADNAIAHGRDVYGPKRTPRLLGIAGFFR